LKINQHGGEAEAKKGRAKNGHYGGLKPFR